MRKLLVLLLAMMMLLSATAMGESLPEDEPAEEAGLLERYMAWQELLQDQMDSGRKITMDLNVSEVSGISLGDAAADAAVNDLLRALGVRIVGQGDDFDMALTLSGKDALTLGWASNGDDAYIRSNLIGGTVVLSAQEIEPLTARLTDMLVMMDAMTEEDAAYVRDMVPALIEEITTAMKQGADLTEEELSSLDYSALINGLLRLLVDLEETDAAVLPRTCDPAVYGVSLRIDNEELVGLLRACMDFVNDNPRLREKVASQGEFYTQEEIDEMWLQMGEMYMEHGVVESEEEFREIFMTFDQVMEGAYEMLDTAVYLDGEFVTNVYFSDAGEIVYLTSTLPMYTEIEAMFEAQSEGMAAPGVTETLNMVYTRQTVSEGVSHVLNLDCDGEGMTVDVLVKEAALTICVSEMETLAQLLTIEATCDGDNVTGTYATNPEEETVLTGSFALASDIDEELYDVALHLDVTSVFTPEDAGETPSLNGMTLPGFEQQKPQAKTDTAALDFSVVYRRNGADVTGTEKVVVDVNDFHIVLEGALTTGEPVDSIISGEVVRPAELDDAAFANWFVGVVSAASGWAANFLMLLPESVMTLFMGGLF